MIITYHGSGFIKAQTGDVVVAFNPVGKGSSFKESRFGSDIALVSVNHPDFNGVEQLVYKDRQPFIRIRFCFHALSCDSILIITGLDLICLSAM